MNKFSKINKSVEDEYIYERGHLKIKDKDNYTFVVENDCVVMIPHLIEYDEILMRKETVPSFREKKPNQEFFLTSVSGTMEEGETEKQTLIREIEEECGIRLNTNYNGMVKIGDFHWNKGNSSLCHIYYVPLEKNDYRKVEAIGDGGDIEKKSSTVRVDLKYLKSLNPSDLVSAYCVNWMINKKEL